MSDSDLRELERRWRSSRDPQDRSCWLNARHRAGDLDPAGLRLASQLGDPDARRLLPGQGEVEWRFPRMQCGVPPALAGGVACVRALAEQRGEPVTGWTSAVLAACEAFLERPGEDTLDAVVALRHPERQAFAYPAAPLESAAARLQNMLAPFRQEYPLGANQHVESLSKLVRAVAPEQPWREPMVELLLASPTESGGTWAKEARWLARRLELGLHERRQLLILEACGHLPASLALGRRPAPPPDLRAWLVTLLALGLGWTIAVELTRPLPFRENPAHSDLWEACLASVAPTGRPRPALEAQLAAWPHEVQDVDPEVVKLMRRMLLVGLGRHELSPDDLLPLGAGDREDSMRQTILYHHMPRALLGVLWSPRLLRNYERAARRRAAREAKEGPPAPKPLR